MIDCVKRKQAIQNFSRAQTTSTSYSSLYDPVGQYRFLCVSFVCLPPVSVSVWLCGYDVCLRVKKVKECARFFFTDPIIFSLASHLLINDAIMICQMKIRAIHRWYWSTIGFSRKSFAYYYFVLIQHSNEWESWLSSIIYLLKKAHTAPQHFIVKYTYYYLYE